MLKFVNPSEFPIFLHKSDLKHQIFKQVKKRDKLFLVIYLLRKIIQSSISLNFVFRKLVSVGFDFCLNANFFPFREDMYSQDSIDLLQNSGLQFKKHEEEGIDTLYFAELLMTSGLVLCENVRWLSFHR